MGSEERNLPVVDGKSHGISDNQIAAHAAAPPKGSIHFQLQAAVMHIRTTGQIHHHFGEIRRRHIHSHIHAHVHFGTHVLRCLLSNLLLFSTFLNLTRALFQAPGLTRSFSGGGHKCPYSRLKTIGRTTLWREEHGAVHQGQLFRLEAECSVEKILLDLIEMEFQIGTDQLLFLYPFENETLTDRLRADHQV